MAQGAANSSLGQAEVDHIQVQPNTATDAPDLQLVSNPPVVDSITPTNAGPGSTVIIEGSNFGATTAKDLSVQFAGAPATTVNRQSDNSLSVVVPQGATSGDVLVTVGGVAAAGFPFTVVGSLSISPQPILAGSTVNFPLTATDTGGKPIAYPQVQWSLGIGTAPAPVASGSFSLTEATLTGLTPGAATLSVSAGSVTTVVPLDIFAVTGVTLSTDSVTLDGLPTDGTAPDPGFVTSASLGATVAATDGPGRKVTWSSSDPTIVTVDASGDVSATETPGSATITATSVDDPTKIATASVVVTSQGQLDLGIN